MATMADVARAANVSVSTVSHVVNGTRVVDPATAELVRVAIETTGYIRNSVARSLATRSTESLGLALSMRTSNFYFADLAHAVETAASDTGRMVLLGETHEDPARELAIVRTLRGRRVDGIILGPCAAPGWTLDYLRAQSMSAVLIDRLPDDSFDQVGTENTEALATLVEHLADHGHVRIGFIAGMEGLTTSVERLEGYRVGLQRAGLDVDTDLIIKGESSVSTAEIAVRALMDRAAPPTALVAGNLHMTIGIIKALRDLGLQVPTDIAMVTFDDFDWAEYFSPRLTTVAQDCTEMGRVAVQLMTERIKDPTREPSTVRLTPTLKYRDSCGCGAAGLSPTATDVDAAATA